MPIDTDDTFDIEGLRVSAFDVDLGESDEASLTSGYGLTEVGASNEGKGSCCCSVSCLSCA